MIIANAAILKSEIPKSEIYNYKTILSNAEKYRLCLQELSDTRAAINLTTEIDRTCNSCRSQYIDSRLIIFLELIQKFSQIVDIFVSSYSDLATLI